MEKINGKVADITEDCFQFELSNESIGSCESLTPKNIVRIQKPKNFRLRKGLMLEISGYFTSDEEFNWEDGKLDYPIPEDGFFFFFKKYKIYRRTCKKILNNFDDFVAYPKDYIDDGKLSVFSEAVEFSEDNIRFGSWLAALKFKSYQIESLIKDINFEDFLFNPYALLDKSLNFIRIDRIRKILGIEESDPSRLESLVSYILDTTSYENGHLFLKPVQILSTIEEWASNKNFIYSNRMSVADIKTICDRLETKDKVAVEEEGGVYSKQAYIAETGSAMMITDLIATNYLLSDIDTFMSECEERKSVKNVWRFSEEQKKAIKLVNKEKVSIITGLPGTGKSTITSSITELFEAAKVKYMLFSPTGIAAKRLSKLTDRQAYTIHRGLGYKGDYWRRNEDNPLDVDAIIVDESSMVDQFMFFRLLRAIQTGTRVVIIGDYNQLPSVGPGNVLRELVSSKIIPSEHLTKIYRQDEESSLVANAHRINRGEIIKPNSKDFLFLRSKDYLAILDKIVGLSFTCHKNGIDHQVITPVHQGTLGTKNLNRMIRNKVNPYEKGVIYATVGDKSFREKDKIMVVKNDYRNEVYNGDMGYIKKIRLLRDSGDIIDYEFEIEILDVVPKTVVYKGEELDNLMLAYASTVHKSQGNEFDMVIMPIVDSFTVMLERNLLYTAITRAKKKLVMLGEDSAINRAISVNRAIKRNTLLKERIV